MEKIRELKSGVTTTIALVVLEATPRKTKTGKDYLAVKLSDGETQIAGNMWDWDPANEVFKNVVYDVKATVTEWQGTLQLNIYTMALNTNKPLTDFMPSSGNDIDAVFSRFENKASFIGDTFLKTLVNKLLKELEGRWKTVPGAKAVHHAYVGGTLIHSDSVAKIAYDIAMAVNSNVPVNTDLVIAGAMLHDVGKLFTYGLDGVTIDYTDEGQLYEHAFMGAELVGNVAEELISSPEDEKLLGLLRHIILSHHKTLEHGAVITPKCLEAYIVHHADAIDATAEQLRVADTGDGSSAWTDKVWALDNMRHVKPSYIQQLASGEK